MPPTPTRLTSDQVYSCAACRTHGAPAPPPIHMRPPAFSAVAFLARARSGRHRAGGSGDARAARLQVVPGPPRSRLPLHHRDQRHAGPKGGARPDDRLALRLRHLLHRVHGAAGMEVPRSLREQVCATRSPASRAPSRGIARAHRESAHVLPRSQKYKEGKFIVEKSRVLEGEAL